MSPRLQRWAERLYEIFSAAAWPPAADTWLFPCDPPSRAEREGKRREEDKP